MPLWSKLSASWSGPMLSPLRVPNVQGLVCTAGYIPLCAIKQRQPPTSSELNHPSAARSTANDEVLNNKLT